MKTFRFTTLSGTSLSIDLDSRTYDALAHESSRGWGDTLDWHDAHSMTEPLTNSRFIKSCKYCRLSNTETRYRVN